MKRGRLCFHTIAACLLVVDLTKFTKSPGGRKCASRNDRRLSYFPLSRNPSRQQGEFLPAEQFRRNCLSQQPKEVGLHIAAPLEEHSADRCSACLTYADSLLQADFRGRDAFSGPVILEVCELRPLEWHFSGTGREGHRGESSQTRVRPNLSTQQPSLDRGMRHRATLGIAEDLSRPDLLFWRQLAVTFPFQNR